jgi:uncharacterized membrane protein
MASPEKESGNSGITGTLAVVGVACGFIGAVIGALGWDLWKKEEMQQQHRSPSGYVICFRVKGAFSCVADQLWKVCLENTYGSGS